VAREELFRWRIQFGFFWEAGVAVPGAGFWRIPLAKVLEKKVNFLDGISWSLDPIANLFRVDESKRIGESLVTLKPPRKNAFDDSHFDFLPDGKNRVLAFLRAKERIQVWSGRIPILRKGTHGVDLEKWLEGITWANTPQKKADDEPVIVVPRPTMEIQTEMNEPFITHRANDTFLFVSKSGKLYACPDQGKNLKTSVVWDEPENPITTLVSDTLSGKTFAFTRSKQKKKDVFFELRDKISPQGYDASRIPALSASAPLRSIAGYVRLLAEKGRIEAPNLKAQKGTPKE
jgi:hypothetical protein